MAGARQFDEQEVITLALDVFWQKGLHDATMQDLAAATGVQRGSLYNAYGDKESIFLQAFDQYAEQFLKIAEKALAHGDIAVRLQTFFETIIKNMTSGAPPRGCLTTRTAMDAGISSRNVRERVRRLHSGLEGLIAQAIAAASGDIAASEARALARVIATFTRGLAVLERAGYTRKQLNDAATTFIAALVRKA